MEMLIVVALFTVITGAALMNHGRFGEGILATNLAYDIALSLREAQSYGLSVREAAPGTGLFDVGYGVHFFDNTFFVFFADRNSNRRYDGTSINDVCLADTECVKVYRLERGSSISSFCSAVLATSVLECRVFPPRFENDPPTDTTISFLDISFKRPLPDAFMRTDLNSNNAERYRSAQVRIVSPRGKERRTIEVFQTGQISIR
jgi:hypothetical protein